MRRVGLQALQALCRCGEPSGRHSEGGRALMGLKNHRGKDQPMWCTFCHPEHHYLDMVWSALERMGG
jgi:hypothetical protein